MIAKFLRMLFAGLPQLVAGLPAPLRHGFMAVLGAVLGVLLNAAYSFSVTQVWNTHALVPVLLGAVSTTLMSVLFGRAPAAPAKV